MIMFVLSRPSHRELAPPGQCYLCAYGCAIECSCKFRGSGPSSPQRKGTSSAAQTSPQRTEANLRSGHRGSPQPRGSKKVTFAKQQSHSSPPSAAQQSRGNHPTGSPSHAPLNSWLRDRGDAYPFIGSDPSSPGRSPSRSEYKRTGATRDKEADAARVQAAREAAQITREAETHAAEIVAAGRTAAAMGAAAEVKVAAAKAMAVTVAARVAAAKFAEECSGQRHESERILDRRQLRHNPQNGHTDTPPPRSPSQIKFEQAPTARLSIFLSPPQTNKHSSPNAAEEESDEFIPDRDESDACVWSPGSETGMQGSDLMSAKRTKQASPLRSRLGATEEGPASAGSAWQKLSGQTDSRDAPVGGSARRGDRRAGWAHCVTAVLLDWFAGSFDSKLCSCAGSRCLAKWLCILLIGCVRRPRG